MRQRCNYLRWTAFVIAQLTDSWLHDILTVPIRIMRDLEHFKNYQGETFHDLCHFTGRVKCCTYIYL